jgi:hypothetical protein
MFGRKKVAVDLTAEQRKLLAEACKPVIAEIDDIIERCAWFLDPSRASEVPSEYVVPLRQTLEHERRLRAKVVEWIRVIPTGPIMTSEMEEDFKAVNQATLAANDLLMRAGSDAAVNIMLGGLQNNGQRSA